MTLFAALLLHPAFRTFLTGAGFFSDSYDLFITDGVTNMLKDLGPVQRVSYSYQPVGQPYPTNLTSYFSAYCVDGVRCLPKLYNSATGTWDPNPSTTFTPEFTPHYQLQTPALKNAVSNAALIGSITGQLVFGFAGDVLGRKWCFVLTTMLIIVGCLGSATAAAGVRVAGRLNAAGAWGDTSAQPAGFTQDVYAQLVFWRAILGFGVGGEYPLAGTIASEGAKDTASRGKSVLYTFSMQGWGKLTASLVNYFLVSNLRFFGGAWTLDGAWRFALGLGCTLNLLTVPFRWYMEESHIFSKSSVVASSQAASVKQGEEEGGEEGDRPTVVAGGASSVLATLALPTAPSTAEVGKASKLTLALLWEHRWTLVGTAGCWFLIDVTFYGQSLMNTTVVSEAVASTIGLNAMQKLRSSLLSTVWIMLIAIPGYWIAIFTVDWLGRKPLQRLGFLATAAVFLVLGLAYNTPLRTTASGGGFVFLYGLTYLFSNAGPNSVTFLMPAEAFPVREGPPQCHNLSAPPLLLPHPTNPHSTLHTPHPTHPTCCTAAAGCADPGALHSAWHLCCLWQGGGHSGGLWPAGAAVCLPPGGWQPQPRWRGGCHAGVRCCGPAGRCRE